jgi:hypothetical protein
MACGREPSVGSCSAATGDDNAEPQHSWVPVVERTSCAPVGRGGGDGAGRFGIYQGNWGGNRRQAALPEMTN